MSRTSVTAWLHTALHTAPRVPAYRAMTLGISLALTLGAGLYVDSGPTVLKCRFEAAWGKTEVFVANVTAWELARDRAWQHTEVWSIRFAQNHQFPYGLRLERGCHHPYGDMRQHRRKISAPWGNVPQAKARHVIPYTDLGTCRKSMRVAYWLTCQRPAYWSQLRIGV